MKFLDKNINLILIVLIIGFIITDFLSSFFLKLVPDSFYRYSAYFKIAVEVFMISVIVLRFKKFTKVHFALLFITLSFIISQYITYTKYNLLYHFVKGNIYFFNRYVFILIFIIFINGFEIKKETYFKIVKYIQYVLIVNFSLILVGFFLNLDLFMSYEGTGRFGFSGLFSKPEEAAYLYAIGVIYNYYFFIKNKENKHLILSLMFVFSILMLGQKKMILFLFLVASIHVLFHTKYKFIFRWVYSIVLPLTIVFIDKILIFIISFSPFWSRVYREYDLLNALTSYRSMHFKTTLEYIKETWSFSNYIFGGLDFGVYKVEYEVFDLYIFLGLSGLYFYYFFIKNYLYHKKYSNVNRLVGALFVTSFFSGGLLLSVTATVILYITVHKVMLKD